MTTALVPQTLYDKIWDAHVVQRLSADTCVLYVDRHLLDEVHSPQAFAGLRRANRPVRRPADICTPRAAVSSDLDQTRWCSSLRVTTGRGVISSTPLKRSEACSDPRQRSVATATTSRKPCPGPLRNSAAWSTRGLRFTAYLLRRSFSATATT